MLSSYLLQSEAWDPSSKMDGFIRNFCLHRKRKKRPKKKIVSTLPKGSCVHVFALKLSSASFFFLRTVPKMPRSKHDGKKMNGSCSMLYAIASTQSMNFQRRTSGVTRFAHLQVPMRRRPRRTHLNALNNIQLYGNI